MFLRRREETGGYPIQVLEIIQTCPDKAYGTAIAEMIAEKLGDPDRRDDAHAFITLKRLHAKGMIAVVSSDRSESPTGRRASRKRKLYELTAAGRAALEDVERRNAGDACQGALKGRSNVKEGAAPLGPDRPATA